MRVAVVGAEGGGLLQAVAEDGAPSGPPEPVRDLAAAVAERERAGRPRCRPGCGSTAATTLP